MVKLIYNGDGAIFGRLASKIAKDLLKGDEVVLVNCGKIIVSGDKKLFVKKILAKREMGSGGSMKGPKYPRTEDRLVKRMIRGMLPRDRARGRDAIRRLMCYAENVENVEGAIKLEYKKPMRFSTIKEIVRALK